MAELIWARWNVPVLGRPRLAEEQVERTPLIASMLAVGYLSEIPAPPADPVPDDLVTTPADVVSAVNTALADPQSGLSQTVNQRATSVATSVAGAAANAAAEQAAVQPQLTALDAAKSSKTLTKLRRWYAGLGGREALPAELLMLGDSITEGVGASVLPRRAQNLLQRSLRAALGYTGAEWPYIPAHWGADWYAQRPSVCAGTWTPADQYGLGKRAVSLPDATGSVTFTFTGTSCRLIYTRSTGGGIVRIVIDGGAATLVDSYQSGTTPSPASWSSPALARGVHTVVVTRDATSTTGEVVTAEGLVTYDGDEARGIRVVDGAHSGSWASQFAPETEWADGARLVATGQAGGYAGALLVWGTNDFGGGRTAAQFKADNLTIIATLRARGFTGSIVLVLLWLSYGRDDTAWTAYGQVLQDIAAADQDVLFFSMRDYMPDPTSTDSTSVLGLHGDGIHPTDRGMGYMADVYTQLLLPRAG